MADRRSFLGAVSGAAATFVLAGAADAQTPAAPPVGTPAPSPSASPKPPSAAARAQAEAMRRFDPRLSDAQIERIAQGIDGVDAAGEHCNPKGAVLTNADEPATKLFVDAIR